MGNVTANTSEPISFDSPALIELIKTDCEYTVEIGKCSTSCGEGIQKVNYKIKTYGLNGGKLCPKDYFQKCYNPPCIDPVVVSKQTQNDRISFINILNIPILRTIGSKLFSINLNNISDITLKEGFYVSIEYYSFFNVNFQFISLSINDDIFPISSSIFEKDEGYFKHNFLITSTTKIKPYGNIILNLFIWDYNLQPTSYTIQINANSPSDK
jgi:hypothetical protein